MSSDARRRQITSLQLPGIPWPEIQAIQRPRIADRVGGPLLPAVAAGAPRPLRLPVADTFLPVSPRLTFLSASCQRQSSRPASRLPARPSAPARIIRRATLHSLCRIFFDTGQVSRNPYPSEHLVTTIGPILVAPSELRVWPAPPPPSPLQRRAFVLSSPARALSPARGTPWRRR
jgi:hypothetical protein